MRDLISSHLPQFSGILKNCTCRGGFSRYLDFESAEFYRDPAHFNVELWWVAAAVIAAIPVVVCFLVALVLLFILRPLWQDSELDHNGGQGEVLEDVSNTYGKADMNWVS